ncbi:hypothetical protein FACS189432_01090 [Bacteroidia bacterium]|nr:hypothetical protein FACS189432_01090 [Bacteroidia bacterium]
MYKNELDENISHELSPEDSILTAEHFIRTWINDALLYDVASKNIADKEQIERLVNNYRKSLVIYQYQEQLINEKLTKAINEQALLDYYQVNGDKFKLETPLVKGIFLKIPVNAPQMNEIRTWYKSTAPDTREKLEKYSLYNVVTYDYFVDQWMDFAQVAINLPSDFRNINAILSNNKHIERSDSSYCYFLNITDYRLPGDDAPFEFAKANIQEVLINQQKIEFLKQTEEDLYQRAVKKGEIMFYNE